MIGKIILNVLLNIAIITLGMTVYWSVTHEHYGLTLALVFSVALLLVLKIRLLKNVKSLTKKD